MIKVGEHQTLKINREMPQGYYLIDDNENEVLMPRKYIEEGMDIGNEVEVFVYCDSNDREVATSEKPLLTVGKTALLKAMDSNRIGAFCDWGVTKQLFVPFSNQANDMVVGNTYLVHMYFDNVSERLVGTTKLHQFYESTNTEVKKGDKVKGVIYAVSNIGYRVLVDNSYIGLLYKTDSPHLNIGDNITAYIRDERPDHKVDLSYYQIGHKHIEPNSSIILKKLEENEGFMSFNDKSSPEDILKEFNMSKKMFKKSLGLLYKSRVISLEKDGIRLLRK